MVSHRIDATNGYNANGYFNVATGSWDYIVVDIIAPTGTVSFNATTDSGDIQGVTDGNAQTAKNWQPIQLTNIANGANVTSAAATGNFKFNVGARFFQLIGPSCGKITINFSSIS